MSTSASALIAPGAIVAGKYRLEAIIGEGGMGSVWAATHTGLGQAVAIKFVSREFVTSSEALRRFDAEAKAAAQLRSRHVVQVFDNGTLEDGTPYIAMELLRGENLYSRVHRAGPVPLQETVEILVQSCKALGRAHAAGIGHRDIKPDNIFLAQSNDDDAGLVKVLDFGIAKFAVGPNDHGSTRTGTVLGTPLYMSPEQARGLKTIDHRTDLYSLGLVAYTLLTGNLAFSSESFGDLLLQICTAPLPSLCANAPWLPPSLEGWFQRACARDPQERFGSAQEFSDALRAACAGSLRAPAVPPSVVQPALVFNGGPVQAVSVGTASGMSRSGDSSASTTVPKGKGPLVAVASLLVVGGIGVAVLLTFARKEHAPATVATAAALPSPAPSALAAATIADPTPVVSAASAGVPALPGADAAPAAIEEPSRAVALPAHTFAHSPSPPPAVPPTPPPPPRPPAAAPGNKPIDLGY
jgi:eukaryotic-like serine/threonine-protein kinase